MSTSNLPERPSLEYLKKLAKDRLAELRRHEPGTKLATALLSVAQEHGFSSWRALKAEVDRRQSTNVTLFIKACANGDLEVMRGLLTADPGLARLSSPDAPHKGWTGLHAAAQNGHTDAVRLLLEHGADPNAREAGDNTYPLHWAAAGRHLETARVLLDAGGEVIGAGDVHELEVIGWATFYHDSDHASGGDPALVSLLIERGAHHHIFSAMSVGDLDLIRNVAEQNPDALDRRMSRFEQKQTSLHFAINRKRYDILDLLIELGADLEAVDVHGHTALESVMLAGDREAINRLRAAGAKDPVLPARTASRASIAELAKSTKKGVPMIHVPDIGRTLDWYASIGFKELARYPDEGVVNFGMVSFGGAELMLNMNGKRGEHDVSLWFYTDRVDEIYERFKVRQLESVQGGTSDLEPVEFVEQINDTFYGARQFGIRDLNGYILYFIQNME